MVLALAQSVIKQEPAWPLPNAAGAATDVAVTPPAMEEQSAGSGEAVAPALASAGMKQEPLWPVPNADGAAADVAITPPAMYGEPAKSAEAMAAADTSDPLSPSYVLATTYTNS